MARKKERDSGTLFDVFETANGKEAQAIADAAQEVCGNGVVQADVAETLDDRVPPGSDVADFEVEHPGYFLKQVVDVLIEREEAAKRKIDVPPVRRAAPVDDEPVSHEPLRSLSLTQSDMFAGTEEHKQKTETFEGCKVDKPPVIVLVNGKKEWVCTFRAPADLWHQDRDDLVHARTGTKELISMANKARLQPGDLATVVGIVTLEQELMIEGKLTHLTFINVTDIRPGLRASNQRINGRSPSRRM